MPLTTTQKWGLHLENLVGQGYDGASVMSSPKNGVNGIISRQYPKALFVQCRSHSLALVMSSSCRAVLSIKNLFDDFGKLTLFIGGSAKCKSILYSSSYKNLDEELLSLLVADNYSFPNCTNAILEGSRRKSFQNSVKHAGVTTLSALIAKYGTVLDTLIEISHRSFLEKNVANNL